MGVKLVEGVLLVPSLMACQFQALGEGVAGRLSSCQHPWSDDEAVMESAVSRASNCWKPTNSMDRMVIADLVEYPIPLGVVFFHYS